MTILRRRLIGLAALLIICALMAGVPALLLHVGATPWTADWSSVRFRIRMADDGTLLVLLLSIVAWLGWAYLAWGLIAEAMARARGIRAPQVRGFALSNGVAVKLLDVAALLFATVPTLAPLTAAPAHATVVAQAPLAPAAREQPAMRPAAAVPTAAAAEPAPPLAEPATVPYTVRQGDSLWKIAKNLLGDGRRYHELVALNTELLERDPGFILPGTVLQVPDTRPIQTAPDGAYVVQPGDTLSQIAADLLSDADRWPELLEESKHTIQPDGDQLSDPDLIRPGWVITYPAAMPTTPPATEQAPPVQEPTAPKAPADAAEREAEPAPVPDVQPSEPAPTAGPLRHDVADAEAPEEDPDVEEDDQRPAWLLPGLTGAGAILAGSLYLTVRARRRTRLRLRKPGYAIAPLPPELVDTDKSIHLAGADAAGRVQRLQAMLGELSTSYPGLTSFPRITAVELTDTTATLRLADDGDLPGPWAGTGRTWTAPLHAQQLDTEHWPPAPLLVTVGDDADGHVWLLNLEQLRRITLTGPADRVEAFARHLAAEIALSPWAKICDVDAYGVLDPGQAMPSADYLHRVDDDTTFLTWVNDEVDPARAPGFDPDRFHVLLTGAEHSADEGVRTFAQHLAHHPTRPAGVLVVLGGPPRDGYAEIVLTDHGRLRVPSLGLEVRATGLSAGEATSIAAVVELVDDLDDHTANVPYPVDESAAEGPGALVDVGGSLRAEFVSPRPDDPAEPAGPGSLLAAAATDYAEASPITTDDVAALAPVAPPETTAKVEETDPGLDDDVADWFDKTIHRPRVWLLGPVKARTKEDPTPIAKRPGLYTGALAYLALRGERGATTDQVSNALDINPDRVRGHMSVLRKWLGTNIRTGAAHMPPADKSEAARERGVPVYVVEDVLVDLDLFRRLRARGEARGERGINDLRTALKLITGQPFEHADTKGWMWVFEGSRLDLTIAAAVVDVACIVAADALRGDDLVTARWAVEVARKASPHDENPVLHQVEILLREGNQEAAQALYRDAITRRSDDDRPGPATSTHTRDASSRWDWAGTRRRPN
ncbi:LysM peptidoglycan-binding domain-containing protein [Georgenia thermotolerans]|uniref:LysM peptidoglycan-binding domain-containing protein n=1 Tax=Georgenia thermotolerans TaxID=527326 RepID=A0A7J5USV8_9MICO|nr:LysM peptidoglycan-binding domain-containing protein [Georgenia thermotolerans]KAE8765367.1 LysM peptidoglycan-binding domain-containing protein [Georgenia thermotolerans]